MKVQEPHLENNHLVICVGKALCDSRSIGKVLPEVDGV